MRGKRLDAEPAFIVAQRVYPHDVRVRFRFDISQNFEKYGAADWHDMPGVSAGLSSSPGKSNGFSDGLSCGSALESVHRFSGSVKHHRYGELVQCSGTEPQGVFHRYLLKKGVHGRRAFFVHRDPHNLN